MNRRSPEHWLKPNWVSVALLPLSAMFFVLSVFRRSLYRFGILPSRHPGVATIVIGNIHVGGTGKSPIVMLLAKALQSEGLRVGVVSRGYGATLSVPKIIDEESTAEEVGDEPLMIYRQTGCVVSVYPKRAEAADYLVSQAKVDVVIADDGLQHYALKRDFECCVLGNVYGANRYLLPAGPLRETYSRLNSVDWVLGGDGVRVGSVSETAINLLTGERRALSAFAGEDVHCIAAIANPQRFFDVVRSQLPNLTCHAYPDHAPLSAAELAAFPGPVLMTAKDAVKCEGFADERMWVVEQRVTVDDQWLAAVVAKIKQKVKQYEF
ncbi:MAG: tetraacyldisaccharide 4'-kinase [Gammaproteobacteria bacterium]|nr:tetraacyldisaccharide 4'-kinase [Gammaproteobacteria bacterium]